ncbi:RmlC-like cupin domain-containing protein [Massariosphaeria phaeospora]|uniref:RmlC-like cupin domain-containing protein n=1 Tax=Massariosphaeria phaeospora TaxID=100035 RepID=A0A7C8IJQ3_9PLEO|nr:RmlC-like cupin domain-containing protein [Massariosphaeria phaeospora]
MLPLLTFLLSLPATLAIDTTSRPSVNAELKLAATNLDRHHILAKDSDWTFDFQSRPNYHAAPGSVINANAATFPALTGVGLTLATLNLGPCAMLPPHLHPRATNVVVAVKGNTTSWMVGENGVRTVSVQLTEGVMTIFPAGTLHFMQNNDCQPAQLISALNSEDAGTLNILNALWTFSPETVKAAFGNAELDTETLGQRIPQPGTGANLGSFECLKRCGLDAREGIKE